MTTYECFANCYGGFWVITDWKRGPAGYYIHSVRYERVQHPLITLKARP